MRRIIICNRLLQPLSGGHLISPRIYRKLQISPPHFRLPTETRRFTSLPSNNFRGIAKSVTSKCSYLWSKGELLTSLSLKDHILRLSDISPEIVRRFWRVTVLSPQDVLELLLGFEFNHARKEIEIEKNKSLWGVFGWAGEQSREFQHLPSSCKIMAKLLVRVGLLEEAESLLSMLDCYEIYSDLIEGYVGECELGRAVLNYNRMRSMGLYPSLSCYMLFLDALVVMNEVHLAHGALWDMVKRGMARNAAEDGVFDNVVRLLCRNGRIQEARDIVKECYALGVRPNHLVLDAVVGGYCEKRDYDDILGFLAEVQGVNYVAVCNKAIGNLGRDFGSMRAHVFMQDLEEFGFCPDKFTFGILIGQTCYEGGLRNGFVLLSEMLSRNLKPEVDTCTALMSALFKEGLWKQSLEIFREMKDWGLTPTLSTFSVLIAGLLKAKEIGEVRAIVELMQHQGLIRSALLGNYLSTALALLGLDPLAVKVRRDNDAQFSRTQFYDDLGNGLYWEADVDEFEKTLIGVLDEAMYPDFNSIVLENCAKGDIIISLQMVDEMAQWGQVLSPSTASTLVKKLSTSQMNIKMLNNLLEKMPYSVYGLDRGALNKLVQKYCKRRYVHKANLIINIMLQMKLEIEDDTFSAILISLCRKSNLISFRKCWLLARESNWLPGLKDCRVLLDCLCRSKRFDEALELLETIFMQGHYNPMDVFHAFIEKLCCGGLTRVADVLAKELQEQGLDLDDSAYYNRILIGFCKEKMLAESFTLLDALLAKKFDPSLISSPELIHQLCLAGRSDRAIFLKDRCFAKHPSSKLPVYNALVNGLCRTGMVGEALNFFQELKQRQLADTETYNHLVLGYCRVRDLKRARELLDAMIKNEITVLVSSYRELVRLVCEAGKFSMAWSLATLIVGEGSVPGITVYNILMLCLSPCKETGVIERLVSEIKNRGLELDAVTYSLIIEGYANSADVSRSLWLLDDMISKGFKPSNRSLRKLMKVLCFDKVEKAVELNQEMESRGWIQGSAIQTNIIDSLLRNSKLPEATKFLNQMVSKGSLVPETVDYSYLIKVLCQHGELSKAVDLLNIMIKKGSILDSNSYDYLIQGFCINQKLDIALDYHSEMLYRNLCPNRTTWSVLVRELSVVGRVAEAEGLLKLMVSRCDGIPSKEMYSAVINRYRQENNLKKASEVLREMQESGYEPDFETHWSLIRNFSHPIGKEETGFLSKLLSGIGFAKKG